MHPPNLLGALTPEEERKAVFFLEHELRLMCGYDQDLACAVTLFDYAGADDRIQHRPDLVHCWQRLAAQQAIIAVFNFGKAIKGVDRQLRIAKTFAKEVDRGALDRCTEAFREAFPNIADLRQTVLHQAENVWDEERYEANKSREGLFAGGAAQANLFGSTYVASHGGKEVSFDVTVQKFEQLRAIRVKFFSAFPRGQESQNSLRDGQ